MNQNTREKWVAIFRWLFIPKQAIYINEKR